MSASGITFPPLSAINWHRVRLYVSILGAVALIVVIALSGFDYYTTPFHQRMLNAKHAQLRSSGYYGLRMGMAGGAIFLLLFAYAVRKRWKWLGGIGKTRNWLDFHVLCGILGPVLITFHSGFRLQGLAGVAYWIMIAVMLSGFVGRYFYSQIPRTLSAAELTFQELGIMFESLSGDLESQQVFSREALANIRKMPTTSEVDGMPLLLALFAMLKIDISRPFYVAVLRRQGMTLKEKFRTLLGFIPTRNRELEQVITAVKKQSWLTAKIVFLQRAHQLFHLWHVVHRPFSYSFAVLVLVHVAVVVMLGYFF